ncbi:4310_t:CDS:10 [Cetraspora pellucida]|uniref:4310_t:CDS:1 n=1 Tax=Cetraspora pellucida TaxID=1433469 RepID=A0ACA9LUY0_9GLOM|nr:4310_t:CDS:10 [Cetraspora pellucida]
MSKDIVDDTIHEKVLSYLSEYASQGPDMVATFVEWNVMEIIRACIIQENRCNEIENGHEFTKDSRIVSLSIRFLARLLANDDRQRALLFSQIIYNYDDVLNFILDNAFSEEGLMRYSCIEALEQIVTYELDTTKDATKATAQNDLLEFLISTLDLFNKMQELLVDPQKDIGQRLAALQLILTLASSKTTNAFEFLKRGQLLTRIGLLLAERDRVMRSRANDILCAVLEWAPNPISLLKGASYTNDPITETFDFIITDVVFFLLHNDTNFDMVVVAVNVLDSLLLLVRRASIDHHEKLASRIMDILVFLLSFFKMRQTAEESRNKLSGYDKPDVNSLYTNGTYDKLRSLFLNVRFNVNNEKALLSNILHSISIISLEFNSINTITASIDAICEILFIPNYIADHRILKAVLSVIPTTLSAKIANSQNKESQTINEILEAIQKLMKDTQTECQSVAILLETVQKLLTDNITGQYILDNQYGDEWADALLLKVNDFRWEIRDSVLESVDKLFEESNNIGVGIDFALKYDLPHMVVLKINDNAAYVRASCLKAIKSMICHSNGWKYIVSHNLHIQIASKLPLMIKDTEALVRRAQNQKNKVSEENSLIDENSSWFYWLNGDKFLIDAADNPSRIVRGEILQILRRLKLYLEEKITSNEEFSLSMTTNDDLQLDNGIVNTFGIQSSPLVKKHSDFYRKISLIDFDRLEATIDAEHLYKEALESVNPRMMVNADLIVEGNEDNTLDCYF